MPPHSRLHDAPSGVVSTISAREKHLFIPFKSGIVVKSVAMLGKETLAPVVARIERAD